ncbi:MAG: two-component regulator propeller domain-containing protein [Bacteroidales bacterium]
MMNHSASIPYKIMVSFIAIILLFFFMTPAGAFNKEHISFQKFPLKESLPNSTVKRIFQDHKGYIWLGTETGICRYDGYKLEVIKSNIEHPNLLTSGNILCITEDRHQQIWFGTDRGINVIDQNNQIVPLITDEKIQSLRINSVLCASNGDIWIGSENGLFVYNNNDKTVKSFYHQKEDPMSIQGNNVSHIFEDKSGNIWIALWKDGLCRFNDKHETFIPLPQIGKQNNPFTIYQDAEGLLWVGTWHDGLFRIDIRTSIDNPEFTQFINEKNNPNSISQNSVYSIVEDKATGNLWILSQYGLSIITDRQNVSFENINALDLFSEASNFLNHIIQDRQGNIWIATSNDGVYLANLNKPLFNSNILDDLKRKYGHINVHSIFENENEIWLGLANFGLYVVDKQTQTLKANSKIKTLFDKLSEATPLTIRCISRNMADSSIWMGGNNFLGKVFKKNNDYHFEDLSDKINQFTGQKRTTISALFCDHQHKMWIATRQGLLLKSNDKITMISPDFNNVYSISEERPGVIWAGSYSKGLLRIEEQGKNKYSLNEYTLENGKINSNEINAIIRDQKGQIWVGTNNGGLNKYNTKNDLFDSMNKEFSVLEEDIKNIINDESGNLWLSTNHRIIKINVANKSSIIFSENDNIKMSSFMVGAFLKDSQGKLYFGGGNGYCTFSPHVEKVPTIANKISITDIQVDNQSIFRNFLPGIYDISNHTLHLNYKQRNIGLEFSALNFIAPSNINYAYRLVGVDKDWVYVDSKRRYVNYNHLNQGNYVFEVKSTDENGVWINDITTLNLNVKPAPYETWWAFIIYMIFFSLISIVIYRTIINRIRLKRDLIISKIRQEKSEELTQIKLRYFTNISHELLTPLTIISCLIEDFNHNFPTKFKQYSIMKSNISRLKRLLQQILDFRKVESGNMKLNVKEADLVEFINHSCINNFEPLVKEKHIHFSVSAPNELEAYFDADKIDKVLFNILSNAFKHTPKNGIINLTIQPIQKNDIAYVKIFISDTGSGIASERLPFIFDRFIGNQSDTQSNGIGLSLTKELVEIHKGTISVESQINKGTTFAVELPIDGHIYSSEEKESKIKETQLYPVQLNEEELNTDATQTQQQKNTDILLLVVEDNPDLLMIIANSLSRLYRVIKASNGVEAMKIIKDNEVDLVVSDVMMPEMDGITLCKTIKEDFEFSHTPVLLLTAKNQIEDRIDCYNAGADAYISKPFEMDVLEARIHNLISNRLKKNKEYQTSLNINPKNYEQDSVDDNFLREAIKIVEENLDNYEFSHEQLIDRMSTSKSTFYRKIKSLTGLSPSEFVRNIRLKHACLMLKNRTGNISEVSYAVGFNDPKYFSTCFKSEFGVSPREFIKEFTSVIDNSDNETE